MGEMEIIYPGNISLKVDRDGNATIDETDTCDQCEKVTSRAGGVSYYDGGLWICANCRPDFKL